MGGLTSKEVLDAVGTITAPGVDRQRAIEESARLCRMITERPSPERASVTVFPCPPPACDPWFARIEEGRFSGSLGAVLGSIADAAASVAGRTPERASPFLFAEETVRPRPGRTMRTLSAGITLIAWLISHGVSVTSDDAELADVAISLSADCWSLTSSSASSGPVCRSDPEGVYLAAEASTELLLALMATGNEAISRRLIADVDPELPAPIAASILRLLASLPASKSDAGDAGENANETTESTVSSPSSSFDDSSYGVKNGVPIDGGSRSGALLGASENGGGLSGRLYRTLSLRTMGRVISGVVRGVVWLPRGVYELVMGGGEGQGGGLDGEGGYVPLPPPPDRPGPSLFHIMPHTPSVSECGDCGDCEMCHERCVPSWTDPSQNGNASIDAADGNSHKNGSKRQRWRRRGDARTEAALRGCEWLLLACYTGDPGLNRHMAAVAAFPDAFEGVGVESVSPVAVPHPKLYRAIAAHMDHREVQALFLLLLRRVPRLGTVSTGDPSLSHPSSPFALYALSCVEVESLVLGMCQRLYTMQARMVAAATDAEQLSQAEQELSAPQLAVTDVMDPSGVYVLLAALVELTRDAVWAKGVFTAQIGNAPGASLSFFTERRLPTTVSAGSLIVCVLVRVARSALSRLRDPFMLSTALGALVNVSPHMSDLHPHAAQGLLSLFEVLAMRARRLSPRRAPASRVAEHSDHSTHADRSSHTDHSTRADNDYEEEEEDAEGHYHFARLAARCVLTATRDSLRRCPHLAYAVLYRRGDLQGAIGDPVLGPTVKEILRVARHMEPFLGKALAANGGDARAVLTPEQVHAVIEEGLRTWQAAERTGPASDAPAEFAYEESAEAVESFFLPLAWRLIEWGTAGRIGAHGASAAAHQGQETSINASAFNASINTSVI